MEFGK